MKTMLNFLKTFSISLILFTCFSSLAQNYNLNNYKYRYQKWQLMGFNLNFSGTHNQFNNQRDYIIRTQTSDSLVQEVESNNNHRIALNTPFFYNRYINTERLQQTQSLSYVLALENTNALTQVYQNFNYTINNRFYKGKRFLELNFSTNNTAKNENHSYSTGLYSSNKTKFTDLVYDVSVGKGRGRMEYVSDAVSASFLLKDLKDKAKIRNYNGLDIENVAKGITKIYNTRFMDFRYKLIDQLTLLDSVLRENNIVSENSIRYFTTINDNWLYAKRFARYSGSRWSVNLNHQGRLTNTRYIGEARDTNLDYDNKYIQRSTNNGLSINYTNSKQLGLYFQRSFEFNLVGNINLFTMVFPPNTEKLKNDNLNYRIGGNYSFLYQPNTRTYFMVSFAATYTIQNDQNGLRKSNPNEFHENWSYLNSGISFEFFRFITPRLYYNANSSFGYSKTFQNNSNIFGLNSSQKYSSLPFGMQMGLNYLFF